MNISLIWGRKAMEAWAAGRKPDAFHTISAPNIADTYTGFVRQLKTGTPWVLVGDRGVVLATGTVGVRS